MMIVLDYTNKFTVQLFPKVKVPLTTSGSHTSHRLFTLERIKLALCTIYVTHFRASFLFSGSV